MTVLLYNFILYFQTPTQASSRPQAIYKSKRLCYNKNIMSEKSKINHEYQPDPLQPLFEDLQTHIEKYGQAKQEIHDTIEGQIEHTYYKISAPEEVVAALADRYGGEPLYEDSYIECSPGHILPDSHTFDITPDIIDIFLRYQEDAATVTKSYSFYKSNDVDYGKITTQQETERMARGRQINPDDTLDFNTLMNDYPAEMRDDLVYNAQDGIETHQQELEISELDVIESIARIFKENS